MLLGNATSGVSLALSQTTAGLAEGREAVEVCPPPGRRARLELP